MGYHRLRCHEKRLSEGGECSSTVQYPFADDLLGRLDHIDLRLRQLEEKQKPSLPESESYFIADLRQAAAANIAQKQYCNPQLSSALHINDAHHLKGTLMDRLHMLETRIRQLSSELDKSSGGGSSSIIPAGAFATATQMNDRGTAQQPIPPQMNDKMKQSNAFSSANKVVGGPWRAGEIFHRGTRDLRTHKSKTKVKDPKEAKDAMEKRAGMVCRNDKRRMESTRLYRRWFPVGC